MDTNSDLSYSVKPQVLIIADPEGLAISLIENLLANFCRVKVTSDKKAAWDKLSEHLRDNKNFSVTTMADQSTQDAYDYTVFISSSLAKIYENKKQRYGELETIRLKVFLESVQKNDSKSFAIFPFNDSNAIVKENEQLIQELKNANGKIKVIYVGNPTGPRVLLTKRNPASFIIRSIVFNEVINIPDNFIYPIDVRNLAKSIAKQMFSFEDRSDLAILGSRYPCASFYNEVKRLFNGVNFKVDAETKVVDAVCEKQIYEAYNIRESIADALTWFSKGVYDFLIEDVVIEDVIQKPTQIFVQIPKKEVQTIKSPPQIKFEDKPKEIKPKEVQTEKKTLVIPTPKKVKVKKFKLSRNTKSVMKMSVFIIVSAILIPFIFLLIGFSSMSLGYLFFENGKLEVSKQAFIVSGEFFERSGNIFNKASNLPLTGNVFKNINKIAVVMDKYAESGRDLLTLTVLTGDLIDNITGQEPYSIEKSANSVSLELDSLYRKLSHLEGEVNSMEGPFSKQLKAVFTSARLSEKRQIVGSVQTAFKNLPEALGSGKEKKYLVLLQNDLELRATGGKVSALMVVTFNEGRITDTNVVDVATADGQLRGFVKPPDAIRDYLNEETWYMRDSNWDPDFYATAARAQWFLEKELGVSVDGVVALDLNPVAELLALSGPVSIEGVGSVSDANLYEAVINEKVKQSVPGARDNNAYLTRVLEKMTEVISGLGSDKSLEVSDIIYKNLEGKHLQVALKDPEIIKSLSLLGWDGGITTPNCLTVNCITDWFGIVESNLGENFANRYVEREAVLGVEIDNEVIKRNLKLVLENNGSADVYKVYVRTIVPVDSTFTEIKVINPSGEEIKTPEAVYTQGKLEGGVWVEVSPSERKIIEFNWESQNIMGMGDSGEYALLWRKQAGVDDMNISMSVVIPVPVTNTIPEASLTGGGRVGYNTTLTEDSIFRIYW